MKKATLLLAALLAITTAFSQGKKKDTKDKGEGKGKPTAEQRAQRSVDKLDKVVTLTGDQKTKIYDLALVRAKKHDELKGKSDDKAAKVDEFKAANKQYREAVKANLTPEQIKKLKDNKKEKGKKGKKEKTGDDELTGSDEAEDIISEN